MIYTVRQTIVLEAEKQKREAKEDYKLMKEFYDGEKKLCAKAEKERDDLSRMLNKEIDELKAQVAELQDMLKVSMPFSKL